MTTSYPPGFLPIDTAVNSVKYMTLSAAYAGSLVIPFGLIILYCPVGVRRSPVFPTLIICLFMGIVWGFLSFAENIRTVSSPLEQPLRGVFLGSSSLNFLIPIFTDSVLIWKILWLFNTLNYPTWQRYLLAAPPAIITIPRLVCISIFLSQAGQAYDSMGGILAASQYLATSKLSLAEFILQFISNLYCSAVLLTQAYKLAHSNQALVHRSSNLRKRFNSMFRVLASSFLLPVCIELALIISTATTDNQWIREPIQWSNVYVSLHCAVLATIWSSIGRSSQQNNEMSSNSIGPGSFNRSSEIKGSSASPAFVTSRSFGAFQSHHDVEDMEALSDRSPSFQTGKPASSSIGSHSPNLSYTGWEKTPDPSSPTTPRQVTQSTLPSRPLRVKVDYDSVTYHET